MEMMTLQKVMLALLGLRGGLSPCTHLDAPARGKSFTDVAKVRLPLRCVFLLLLLSAGGETSVI